FGADFKVTDFVEKPANPSTTLVSIGIYFYTKKTVPLFKKYLLEGHSPDRTGDLLEWLHKQADVFVFSFSEKDDHWFDIGGIEMFGHVKSSWPKMRKIIDKRVKKWAKKSL
ncbi:MAG: sugar phosphate nucleotidyltransferase, partial [Candidatus ainarchaeum sp.]|nr:sugar phosphate nucleotidyltransferase [Candidatus ainarchaeum sp.]